MSRKDKTKNDDAWEKIFNKYKILDEISTLGYFNINSQAINEFRESRLMAKFDYQTNLPRIFKENQLSILPTSRNSYIIGHFNTHHTVVYDQDIEISSVEAPSHLSTIDYSNIHTENSALSFAFNTGIIGDLLHLADNDNPVYTISGRMSAGSFSFTIDNLKDSTRPYTVETNNSQCEIDAGFESSEYLLLIEAKLGEVDNFLIRQLFYPYRLWKNKVNKKVVPILMTYSSSKSKFSFFIYEFENHENYNSIKLIEQKDFTIEPESIQEEDITTLFYSIEIKSNFREKTVPFPQANTFDRIIDLLTLLQTGEYSKDEITSNYNFTKRQSEYYTSAAIYLGLVCKYKHPITKEIVYLLTDEANDILLKKYSEKIFFLIRRILENKVFYDVFELTLDIGEIPDIKEVSKIIRQNDHKLSDETTKRRANTVKSWINWILGTFQ